MIRRLALLAALLPLCGFAQMAPIYAGESETELPSPARLPRKARRPRGTRSTPHHDPSRRRRDRNAHRRHGTYAVAHYVIRPAPSREQIFQLPEAQQ